MKLYIIISGILVYVLCSLCYGDIVVFIMFDFERQCIGVCVGVL